MIALNGRFYFLKKTVSNIIFINRYKSFILEFIPRRVDLFSFALVTVIIFFILSRQLAAIFFLFIISEKCAQNFYKENLVLNVEDSYILSSLRFKISLSIKLVVLICLGFFSGIYAGLYSGFNILFWPAASILFFSLFLVVKALISIFYRQFIIILLLTFLLFIFVYALASYSVVGEWIDIIKRYMFLIWKYFYNIYGLILTILIIVALLKYYYVLLPTKIRKFG